MEAITLKSTKQQLVITIDKKAVGQDYILQLMNLLEIERLVHKLHFEEKKLLPLGEEIVQSWWENNKVRLLNPNLEWESRAGAVVA